MALCEVGVLLMTLNYNLCSDLSNQIRAVSSKLKPIGLWTVRCDLPVNSSIWGLFVECLQFKCWKYCHTVGQFNSRCAAPWKGLTEGGRTV